MAKIKFTMENLNKCVCSTCPCQADSICAKEKLVKMQEIMQGKEMPEPDMVAGLYCSSGKTTCSDLDFDRFCQCNYCEVWKENDLENGEPFGYFCRNGKAI